MDKYFKVYDTIIKVCIVLLSYSFRNISLLEKK